jgi:DNA-binding Xre family transcriptional regulator
MHNTNVKVEIETLGALAHALGINPGDLLEYKKSAGYPADFLSGII